MLDLFVAARMQECERLDPEGWAKLIGRDQPDTEQQRLAAFIQRLIADKAPLWRRLGALSVAAAP
ncbi:MAG: hypothetical protein JO213_20510 [Alphaproteobacteria bacterium]|nr:hypothetical protein [Alphaproteobacteria bacterium]